MPTRFRKVRKLRGSRTHTWGQIGQHRKHGAKGGRGMAGGHKHKWTWILKYAPDHFGEPGFVPPTRREVNAINLNQLAVIAEKVASSPSAIYDGGKLVVNLSEMGIDKLLGSGEPKASLKVLVEKWSERAAEKLATVGSEVSKPP